MALPALPQALTSMLLQCSLTLSPLIIYGALTGNKKKVTVAAGYFFALAFLDTVLIFAPKLLLFSGLFWNWQGKVLELAVFLGLAKLLKLPNAFTGFCLPQKGHGFLVGIILGAAFALATGGWSGSPANTETAAFEWTMPGLAEEVSFRGLMLAVIDQQLGRPWKALGVQFGPGAVVTSVFFCLCHMLFFKNDWHLFFDPGVIAEMEIFALAMCWLRYKYESVWPAAWAHNVGNGLPYLIAGIKGCFGAH